MKRLLFFILVLAVSTSVRGQEYEWETVPMDGSRTGCVAPSRDNVPQTVGVFKRGKYIAPDGTVYSGRSATARAARVVLDAQSAMARVKVPI